MKRLDELGVTVKSNNEDTGNADSGRRYDEDIEESLEDRRYDEGTAEIKQPTGRKNRIANHVEQLLDRLGTKARTTVYHSFDELPEADKQHIREREKQGKKVRGWYENGHIYLYLPHIDSIIIVTEALHKMGFTSDPTLTDIKYLLVVAKISSRYVICSKALLCNNN